MDPAEAFRVQSAACAELGSPMYAELAARCATDIETGGPVAVVLAGHEDDPGPSALALRLLGSVHRLVLERRAGELAVFYPSVGGAWDPGPGWRAFRDAGGRRRGHARTLAHGLPWRAGLRRRDAGLRFRLLARILEA